MTTTVTISKRALKELRKAPSHIQDKLHAWVEAVSNEGLVEVRKRPGFHDEPLKGHRSGQRSIRLSILWRAIYLEIDGVMHIEVVEITPHAY